MTASFVVDGAPQSAIDSPTGFPLGALSCLSRLEFFYHIPEWATRDRCQPYGTDGNCSENWRRGRSTNILSITDTVHHCRVVRILFGVWSLWVSGCIANQPRDGLHVSYERTCFASVNSKAEYPTMPDSDMHSCGSLHGFTRVTNWYSTSSLGAFIPASSQRKIPFALSPITRSVMNVACFVRFVYDNS